MKVVKIGGSLERSGCLADCLSRLLGSCHGDLVIVPGGGIFADQVRLTQRRWGFDDVCAHHMAVLAMQQMALLFRALQQRLEPAFRVEEISDKLKSGHNVVWLPDINDLNRAGIEAVWDVTSDSLSAWLAGTLGADELLLIKSADIPLGLKVEDLAGQGIVDNAFVRFAKNSAYKVSIINKDSL
ncbi:MAG: amino acid kinase family protein [Gammaproteobacteria bacterium]